MQLYEKKNKIDKYYRIVDDANTKSLKIFHIIILNRLRNKKMKLYLFINLI